jgi:hypothetical protein
MQSVPSHARPQQPERHPDVTEVTGTLVTGEKTGLADIFNEAAVLTICGPTGQKLYWLGAIVDAGRIVGLTLRKFKTGEVYRVTFDGLTWECDCPDATYRERHCKHVVAVTDALTRQPQDRKTERDEATGPGPDLEALARGDWME